MLYIYKYPMRPECIVKALRQ